MNKKEEIKVLVNQSSETLKKAELLYKELLNSNLSLNDKWDIFSEYGENFGDTQCWIKHYNGPDEDICWSDYYIERNETVILSDFIEKIEEELESKYKSSIYKNWTQEHLNSLKEQILKDNCYSFKNDW